jgi:4-amino-4-deoxychorismate lyase
MPQEQLKSVTDFQIITSLRYHPGLATLQRNLFDSNTLDADSPFYLLSFHLDRLLLAAKHFDFPTSLLEDDESRAQFKTWLIATIRKLDPPPPLPAKLRIALDREDHVTLSTDLAPGVSQYDLFPASLRTPKKLPQPPWTVFLSKIHISPSAFTLHKTTYRPMYEEARSILPPPSETKSEVLLYNDEDEISEGSITTPYFYREGRWITPPLSCGGNTGTTRRWALERKLCVEDIILAKELVDGENCWLSNGVRGFFSGKISLS